MAVDLDHRKLDPSTRLGPLQGIYSCQTYRCATRLTKGFGFVNPIKSMGTMYDTKKILTPY